MYKRMRTLLILLLAFIVCQMTYAYDFESGGIYYNIEEGYTVSVTSGDLKYSGSVDIPNQVSHNGTTYSVTSIGNAAFFGCSSQISITIPNSVTTIVGSAFMNCSGLTTITIPNSVTSIGGWAFYGCRGLTSMIVESNNSVYDSRDNCNAIIDTKSNTLIAGCMSTVIPNSVLSIGFGAFSSCSGLTAITIPNNVTNIDQYAFSSCTGLTSITIPNSVTHMGSSSFEGCSGLNSITIANSVIFIGERCFDNTAWYENQPNGIVYAGRVLYKYKGKMPDGTNISIEEGTPSITKSAFSDCSGLNSITIPNSVKSIGDYAFSDCSGLTSIKVESGNEVYDSRNNCNAIIETKSNTLIVGCMNTIITNDVTSIGSHAFYGCSGLTSVTIPNSVKSIGEGAFLHCSGLTSITIPNSVTSIGASAFFVTPWYNNQPDGIVYAGKVLYKYKGTMPVGEKISIEEGTLGIAGCAFSDCDGLASISIPKTVVSIGKLIFQSCSNMKDVYCYAEDLPETEAMAFVGSYVKNAILHVPARSVVAYKAAEPWNQFKEIVAIENTGISPVSYGDTVKEVYSINGERKLSLNKGINIIKYKDGTAKKVFIK